MTKLTEAQWQQLTEAALAAQQRAYAPYSHFTVGAALVDAWGRLFSGANVENASYGLTICAERVAASAAVTAEHAHASGKSEAIQIQTPPGSPRHAWRGIAVASQGGVTPCGACRQFLMEFAPEMEVMLVDSSSGKTQHLGAMQLWLPGAFTLAPSNNSAE